MTDRIGLCRKLGVTSRAAVEAMRAGDLATAKTLLRDCVRIIEALEADDNKAPTG